MSLRCGRRCLGGLAVVVLALLETLVALRARSLWHAATGPGPSSLADLVALAATAAALVLGLWLAGGLALALLEWTPGRASLLVRRLAPGGAPSIARRWAALLVGATLGAGAGVGAGGAAVAAAGPAPTPAPVVTSRAVTDPGPGFTPTPVQPSVQPPGTLTSQWPPDPGWTPSRPPREPRGAVQLVSGPVAARPDVMASASPPADGRDVVVTRGDTLWAIARRALGVGASDAEVARAWPRWYAANRDVIGPDPDLLRPGQVLRSPSRGIGAEASDRHPLHTPAAAR
jgi:hypothetical protein